jgi:hypothetical protein
MVDMRITVGSAGEYPYFEEGVRDVTLLLSS